MEGIYNKLKKALIEMYKSGELDKILKYSHRSERKKIKHDTAIIEKIVAFYETHGEDLNAIPVFSFVTELRSKDVLVSALCFMALEEGEEE